MRNVAFNILSAKTTYFEIQILEERCFMENRINLHTCGAGMSILYPYCIQSPLLGPGAQGASCGNPWGLWMCVCLFCYFLLVC